MKRSVIIATLLCLWMSVARAQRISCSFKGTSMSEALKTIESLSDDYTINFIYDELEDFTVTTRVNREHVPDAVRQVAGFYPVRLSIGGRHLFVECVRKQEHKFRGRIVDGRGRPVPFASIALLSPADSTFITGDVSNEAGDFVIPREARRATARISCVGRLTVSVPFLQERVGSIVLPESAVHLGEVRVRGNRPVVKQQYGMMVVDMAALQEQFRAANAYDLLACIPGVYADADAISYTGREVALIINGKVTTLSTSQVAERLRQMPAEQIARAEVMASAPARYHVRGAAINVVTKDFANQLSGRIAATADQNRYAALRTQSALLYVNNGLSLDADYQYRGGKSYATGEHSANQLVDGVRVPYADEMRHASRTIAHSGRVGLDYAFSEHHRLSAAYSGRWTSLHGHNTQSGTVASKQHTVSHEQLHNADLHYEAPFGLQLGASFLHYEAPRRQTLSGGLYVNSVSNQLINKWLFTADQTHALGRGLTLNYGARAQWTNNKSHQTATSSEGAPLSQATGSVGFVERIVSGYAGMEKTFALGISLETSVAVEHYHRPGHHRWLVCPRLVADWPINKRHALNLSLTADATYPSFWSTLGSVYYSSAYTEIWGNPSLRPTRAYVAALSWMLDRRYTFTACLMLRPDYFVQQAYQPADRLAVVMKEVNYDYSNSLMLQASAVLAAGKWLGGNAFLALSYQHDKNSNFFDLPYNRTQLTLITGMNAVVTLSRHPDVRLTLNPFFQSAALQGDLVIRPRFRISAALRYRIDHHWQLALDGRNLTNAAFDTSSTLGTQDFHMRVWQQWRTVSLALSYTFGSYKEKHRPAADTSRMGH